MSEVSGEQAVRRHRLARRALVPAAIAGLVAIGATGWAAAASNGPTKPTSSTSVSPSPWTGHWKGRSGWDGGGAQEALHGDCVSAEPGGGTQTTVFQRGTVAELSRTSMTVRSSDGYTQRYAVGSATLGDGNKKGIPAPSTNEQIVVIALRGSGDPVAQRVFSGPGH